LPDIQPRVSNDTPSFDALTIVAPLVRFNALDILFAPALDFAIVFNVRTSVAVHGRLTTLFFLAKFRFLFFRKRGCITAHSVCNARRFIGDLIFGQVAYGHGRRWLDWRKAIEK
jgi:hypothetical protein